MGPVGSSQRVHHRQCACRDSAVLETRIGLLSPFETMLAQRIRVAEHGTVSQ
jgi:hypothetical protein